MPDRDVGDGREVGSTADRLLGELIAEVRALKHSQNGASQKLDAVNHIAGTMKEVLRRLEETEKTQEQQHFRIAVLEADKYRREGAVGLVEWFSRHWPVSLLLVLIGALVTWANGKLHP